MGEPAWPLAREGRRPRAGERELVGWVGRYLPFSTRGPSLQKTRRSRNPCNPSPHTHSKTTHRSLRAPPALAPARAASV